MSNIENKEETTHEGTDKPTLQSYKTVCAKLGLSMCIYFAFRILTDLAAPLFSPILSNTNALLSGILSYSFVVLMVYVIPLLAAVFIFKYSLPSRVLYKKPRRVARALGTFPATIGLGYGIALLTLLVSFILSRIFGGETYIEQLLRPTAAPPAKNIADIIMTMILMVVIAPLFEEYWVRGLMFDVLRPYGIGVAIIISSVIFGFMHGSLYMFFYSTAFGLALGYIRYATGSLFTPTILHALVNAISATTLLLESLANMSHGENKVINTVETIFAVSMIILIVVGICVFFAKLPVIKKYRFENPWTDVKPLKKIGIFTVSVPVIIMLVLAFNELSGQLLLNFLLP